jgi:hypothetical protein
MDRPYSLAGASRLPQAWRQDISKGLVIDPSLNVRNEPESMKSVDPPLVLTQVRCLSSARYFAKHPVTILGIRGAEALLKLPSEWDGGICRIGKTPNKCASAWQCARLHVSQKHIIHVFQKIIYPIDYKQSMDSMDCCTRYVPIHFKTCNSFDEGYYSAALVHGPPALLCDRSRRDPWEITQQHSDKFRDYRNMPRARRFCRA